MELLCDVVGHKLCELFMLYKRSYFTTLLDINYVNYLCCTKGVTLRRCSNIDLIDIAVL